DVLVRTNNACFETVDETITPRDDNDRDMFALWVISHELNDLEAVQTRQDQIDKQKIGKRNLLCLEECSQRQDGLLETHCLVSLPPESHFENFTDGGGVINDHDKPSCHRRGLLLVATSPACYTRTDGNVHPMTVPLFVAKHGSGIVGHPMTSD